MFHCLVSIFIGTVKLFENKKVLTAVKKVYYYLFVSVGNLFIYAG